MLSALIEPLGCTPDGKFAYLATRLGTPRILSAAQHRDTELRGIASPGEWLAEIRKSDVLSAILLEGRTLDYDKLADWLMSECRRRGLYDPSAARGRGLWLTSSNEPVFNTGTELVVLDFNGSARKVSPSELRANAGDTHRYLWSTPRACPFADQEISTQDSRRFLEVLCSFSFARGEHHARLVLGWMANATVLNMIEFRPQIAITARLGSGKSALLRAIARALGEANCFRPEGQTTEAGLRQILGQDALPVIFDEFETSHQHAQALFDLLRSASNPNAGLVIKGTSGGTPIRYYVRTMAVVAGITMGIKNEADQSRFALIEMTTRPHSEDDKQKLNEALAPFDSDFGSGLCRRMLNRRHQFASSLAAFRTALRELGMSDRKADLFGHLLAGCHTTCNDTPVTIADAAAEVEWLRPEANSETGGRKCLDWLLAHRLDEGESLGEAMAKVRQSPNTKDTTVRQLLQFGVKYLATEDAFLFANNNPNLEKLYARTDWRNGQHQYELKRLGGDNFDNKTVCFGHIRSKATRLSASLVLADEE